MTNTSMTQAERKRRQMTAPDTLDVWAYLGGDYEKRWDRFSMILEDVQERTGPLEVQLRHLVGGDGRSYLLIAGPNLLDDFRQFIKAWPPRHPG